MKVLITTSKHIASFQLAILLKNEEVLFGDQLPGYPLKNSNSLAHQILTFCLDHQIKKLYPLQMEEVEELRKSLVLFDEFGIEIMLGADGLGSLNHHSKEANSYAELSSNLIALGYPNEKIAVADAKGRGGLILIDDAVADNMQIWNHVNAITFTQLGKWFNHSSFQPVFLYQLNGNLEMYFVLIDETGIKGMANLPEHALESLKALTVDKKLKGFYHISFADKNILRIVNAIL
nr:hypothetical protein [uncultured Pedobacter sp.]